MQILKKLEESAQQRKMKIFKEGEKGGGKINKIKNPIQAANQPSAQKAKTEQNPDSALSQSRL